MALVDSRTIIPTKVDDFDLGYTSKFPQQNEEIKPVFDPSKIFKEEEEEEEEVAKHKEEIKDPGHTSKTEDNLARLAELEALFALRRSEYPFPKRPPYYKPNPNSEEELADLYMTREEWKAHLDKHPDEDPTVLKITRYFDCVEAIIKGELSPRKPRQPKSDEDSDYELSSNDSVGCISGLYATECLAKECASAGFNGETNPHFTRDMGFTVDDDYYDYADDEDDDDDDCADDEDGDDDFTDDEDDDGLKDEIVVNSGTSSAPAASNMGE